MKTGEPLELTRVICPSLSSPLQDLTLPMFP